MIPIHRSAGTSGTKWINLSFSFLMILILAVATAGCGDSSTNTGSGNGNGNGHGNGNGNGNGNEVPETDEVFMQGLSFSPSSRTVETGTTVTWTNKDNVVHTVTSGDNREHDGLFDSGNLAPGATFTYTFDEPGTYPYFCQPHVGMSATLIVEDP